MMQTAYKIKKSLTIPLVLDACLSLLLLPVAIFKNGSAIEIFMLSVGCAVLLIVALELMIREIITDDSGMRIKKILKKKELFWNDITHVGSMAVHKKIYLLLTTTKGFHIISNAYANFPSIVKDILAGVEKDRIEEGISELVQSPVRRVSDIILSWAAAFMIAGIIFIKLFG